MSPHSFPLLQHSEVPRISLHEGMLLLPSYDVCYESFRLPPWQDLQLFGTDKPLCVEFCSGNGEWIGERAQQQQEYNWIAVEKWLKRARQIWRRRQQLHLQNLFLIAGEAESFIRHYLAEGSVAQIHINFPDPWPKKRHAKHRLMQETFISQMVKVLQLGGQLHFVTDDFPYLQEALALLQQQPALVSSHPDPFYQTDCTGYGRSYFEQLWRSQGKPIYFLHMVKQAVL